MKGLQRSLSRGPKQTAAVLKMDIPIDVLVAIDGTAEGFGTTILAGLPEGNILIHGIILNLTTMSRLGTNIDADWIGAIGLGTTPLSDGTISGADEDLITEIPTTIASGGVAPAKVYEADSDIADATIDNTAGTLEVNLNILVADADISGNDSLTVVGSLHLSYVVLGDD